MTCSERLFFATFERTWLPGLAFLHRRLLEHPHLRAPRPRVSPVPIRGCGTWGVAGEQVFGELMFVV